MIEAFWPKVERIDVVMKVVDGCHMVYPLLEVIEVFLLIRGPLHLAKGSHTR